MLRLAPLFLLCFWLSSALAQEPRTDLLLDEVVAVIDLRETRVLLHSDLEIEARLARARTRGGQSLKEPLDNRALSAALDRLINELVIVDEAARLQLFEPTRTEVDDGVAALRTTIGPAAFDSFITEFELEETVRDIVRREVRYARYLESRFRFASKPRESDVQAYMEAHPDRDHRPPAVVVAEVRERLSHDRFEQLSSVFVADVRRRSRVRILRDPSAPLGPTRLSGTATLDESSTDASGK